jgi:acyl-CoA thioesterase
MPDALFIPDGDAFVPTELGAGPWDPNALHGGATSALMARAVESLEPGADMFVARMTAEFLRPVPIQPLAVTTSMLRPGNRVQLVGVSVTSDGVEVARATALRIRQKPVEIPDYPRPELVMPVMPELGAESQEGLSQGLGSAMEMRFAEGHFTVPGPAAAWMRLRVPVVAGEESSPLMRVMATADFGNGLSGVLNFLSYIYINPDLTVYLHRLPEGEWICLDAVTSAEPNGVGFAESRLWDRHGTVGRSAQALLIDQRGA